MTAQRPIRRLRRFHLHARARPTHSYLGLSPGLDFETGLVAKVNAAGVLRRELAAPSYRAAVVNLGSATDAYQPVERDLRLTRAVLEVLAETRHPVAIVTKASLIERDLDLLAPMAEQRLAAAFVSVTTLDHGLSRTLEPRAASPTRRLRTIESLARAGVPVCVNVHRIGGRSWTCSDQRTVLSKMVWNSRTMAVIRTVAPTISVAMATSTASQPLSLRRSVVALKRASNFSSGIRAITSASMKPATTGTISTKNAGVWYQLRTPRSKGSVNAVTASGSHHLGRPR